MDGVAAAISWLEGREQAPPPALRERMREALRSAAAGGGEGADGPVEELLARGAFECLAAALAEAHDRSGALHLLAADALLTYAFEAAAERGPEAVMALAERRGAARLALLLAGTTDEESDRE